MKSFPRISLVTAVREGQPFLARAMDSVLAQRYENLEYIVIDGASRDGSVETIRARRDRLAYWVSEPDSGHAEALNKGFARATGEIFAWLNADDLLAPNALETVARTFREEPRIRWITGIPSDVTAGETLEPRLASPFNLHDFLEGRAFSIQQESTFWRRDLWEACGGRLDESLSLAVDGELWTRFFQKEPLVHVKAVLAGFRRHEANRSDLARGEYCREMRLALANLKKATSWTVKGRAKLWKFCRRPAVEAFHEGFGSGKSIPLGREDPLPRVGYLRASFSGQQLCLEHFGG
ncbi:MAG: glycosyltransferase family 2 protein [Verrucomicrobiota bacterium]